MSIAFAVAAEEDQSEYRIVTDRPARISGAYDEKTGMLVLDPIEARQA